jgi:predicted GNAT family N-acyltransferase
MIHGRFFSPQDDISSCVKIKESVLGDKFNDDLDLFSMHLLVFDNDENAIGTGRIRFDGDDFVIDFIAILEEERRKGYGDFALRMMVDRAFQSQADSVSCICPIYLTSFCQKVGFKPYGEKYLLDDEEVIKMKIEEKDFIFPCHSCGEKH